MKNICKDFSEYSQCRDFLQSKSKGFTFLFTLLFLVDTIILPEIQIPLCVSCKQCCRSIPTAILGYYSIEYIFLNENFYPSMDRLKHQLVLYRVHSKYIDQAAKTWQHRFHDNILTNLTLPESDYYEFLAIPKSRDQCPFLTDQGCKLAEYKPFNCKIFPLQIHRDYFDIASQCPISKVSYREQFKKSLYRIIYQYNEASMQSAQLYYGLVKRLQSRYNFPVVTFKA